MSKVFLSIAWVAVLAVSVHARTMHGQATQFQSATWAVPQSQSLQAAGVHSLVATSFHAIHSGY